MKLAGRLIVWIAVIEAYPVMAAMTYPLSRFGALASIVYGVSCGGWGFGLSYSLSPWVFGFRRTRVRA